MNACTTKKYPKCSNTYKNIWNMKFKASYYEKVVELKESLRLRVGLLESLMPPISKEQYSKGTVPNSKTIC